MQFLIRPAQPEDLQEVQAIYAHHVLHGLASFEEVPPPLEEILRRFRDVTCRGLPYLLAVSGGAILGYGYCAPFRSRSAYRYTLEDSVYVRDGVQGKGVGRALLAALLERSTQLGYRQIIAVIGDSANMASIGLHQSMGFRRAGLLQSSGFKFGRWVDTVFMQRALGIGDAGIPDDPAA